MKKALVLVLLVYGCAQQPIEPTEAQLAVIAYYVEVCKQQGIDPENRLAMKGCVITTYETDVQAGRYAQRSNTLADVIGGIGSVYSTAGASRPVQCNTSNYPGGATTTCR